jgi:hypothetical protein
MAVLMAAASLYSLKALLRGAYLPAGEPAPVLTPPAVTGLIAVAAAILVLALCALKLRPWALAAYGVVTLLGVALSAHYHLGATVPLLIGAAGVAAVAIARRELF